MDVRNRMIAFPLSGGDTVAVRVTPEQVAVLNAYVDMLATWNRRLNLVSRESTADLWTRHIVHSLFLAVRRFDAGSTVVDWGTGGGLPLIPLAVAYPDVFFVGVDSIEKKCQAVRTMIRRLRIANAEVWCGRAEDYPDHADYSVSRATAPLSILWHWHRRASRAGRASTDVEGAWQRGLICLKGGDLTDEIAGLQHDYSGTNVTQIALDSTACHGQFADKFIVCVSDDGPSATHRSTRDQ